MTVLTLPFVLRGASGFVSAEVRPNDEPAAVGSNLVDAEAPAGAAQGFPVCRATVAYPLQGYLQAMGWVQLVQSSDGEGPGRYEVDPLALHREANTPYAFFGLAPDLFDAPFRSGRPVMSWQARSYLCASPDGVVSRAALPVAAFTWGFTISETGAAPVLRSAQPLPLRTWAEHASVLHVQYPGWRFDRRESDVL